MRSAALLSLALLAACAGRPEPRVASASAPAGVKIGKPYQIAGRWYYPADDRDYEETGIASWYGPGFHAKSTANGEPYDQDGMTAAHKTLPMPSFVEVTNLENDRQVVLRVNDRGPFVGDRIIDLSRRSAQLLGVDRKGTAKVRVRRVYPSERDIARLGLGRSAPAPYRPEPVLVAAAPRPAPAKPVLLPASVPAAAALFVQVAALSDRGRAATLAADLETIATPNIESTPTGMHRIRLGPFADAAAAAKVLEAVQAAGYSDARVVGLPIS
jgi:rare lipoprotein A